MYQPAVFVCGDDGGAYLLLQPLKHLYTRSLGCSAAVMYLRFGFLLARCLLCCLAFLAQRIELFFSSPL